MLQGCSGQQSALDAAGDEAAGVRGLWTLMIGVCGFMYLLVLLFLAYALYRQRHLLTTKPDDRAVQAATEVSLTRALTGWTALILVGLLVLTIGSFLLDRRLALANADNALKIKVTATQWWWRIEYEDALPSNRIVTANELRLPVNRPVLLELQAEDVIHSFWVPNLAGKRDLIPGRTNTLLITPRREGTYRGQCAEFCGLQHAQMALDARVVSGDSFERWRERQLSPATPPATPQQQQGMQVFMNGACATCHQIHGTDAAGQTGPDLTHFASRRWLAAGAKAYSPQALQDWLRDPQAVKPGNHMPQVQLATADLASLVAYLDTLK
jgi:cytochrome c oxidase subunit 2